MHPGDSEACGGANRLSVRPVMSVNILSDLTLDIQGVFVHECYHRIPRSYDSEVRSSWELGVSGVSHVSSKDCPRDARF